MKAELATAVAIAVAAAAAWAVTYERTVIEPQKLRLEPSAGIEAALETDAGTARVTFSKTGSERRFLRLATADVRWAVPPQSLRMRVRLTAETEGAARAAAAVLIDGDVWFKVANVPLPGGRWTAEALPFTSLRPAGFNVDDVPDWSKVEALWLGVVLDGPSEGSLEMADIALSEEPYRAARALPVTAAAAGDWRVSKDPAVRATLKTPAEGPGETPCMKSEFSFPGGRHMYLVPSVAAPAADLAGYSGLELTYRAALPEGIDGLLVMLLEDGGAQYYADPAPPPSADWSTITLPFDAFRLGSWSQDPDGRLDLGRVQRIAVGVHGTAAGEGGKGLLMVSGLSFVP